MCLCPGAVRASSIFPIMSVGLLFLGGLCVAASEFYRTRHNVILSAGIFFVSAGLFTACLLEIIHFEKKKKLSDDRCLWIVQLRGFLLSSGEFKTLYLVLTVVSFKKSSIFKCLMLVLIISLIVQFRVGLSLKHTDMSKGLIISLSMCECHQIDIHTHVLCCIKRWQSLVNTHWHSCLLNKKGL